MKTKKIFYNYVMGGSEESFLDEGELEFFPDDYFEEPTPALKGILLIISTANALPLKNITKTHG